jgi:acyl dehydratase
MLPVWSMDPLWPRREEAREPHEKLAEIFDEAGYSGATGIGLEQEFIRPVKIGDRLSFKVKILDVSSDEEQTKLGRGYLLRLLYTYLDETLEVVSTQSHTVLRYRDLAPQLG